MPLIAANRVVAEYPARAFGRPYRAVDGVDLEVDEAETVALVGESGSGKSTLGRMLLGLMPPSSGSVTYCGRGLSSLGGDDFRSFRREVQAVFQDTAASLNPRKSVAASVSLPLRYNLGMSKVEALKQVPSLLQRVGLDPDLFSRRYPHELSGGQRQRVVIARAIACRPRFVVADEPVSALDVSVRAQILQLLRDLQAELGVAFLLITHDLGTVRALASRVLVMHHGRIVESGPTADIFATPHEEYTRTLLAATPIPDPTRRRWRAPEPAGT